jgi:hypothetical protein
MSAVERTSAPPLEAGQRIRQPEFHARYRAMPAEMRAELVGGIVFMPGRVGIRHGVVGAKAVMWLGLYKTNTPGTQAATSPQPSVI